MNGRAVARPPLRYPASRPEPVVDRLHGVEVPDPYRWLEDGASPEVQAWTEAQNALTAAWLGQVPQRAAIRSRLEALLRIGAVSCPVPAGGRVLQQRRDGGQDQPVLYVREGSTGPERVAVDPNARSVDRPVALDWFHPSDDGRRLAYGLSADGSERSTLHVLDLATLTALPDTIPHTRACDVAWLPDASGFYYTRYPDPGSVPPGDEQYHRAVWFHRLGDDPARDERVFAPAAKEHWPSVSLSEDGRWLLVSVARTFDRTDLHVADRRGDGRLRPVLEGVEALFEGTIADGVLYVRTDLEAPTYRLVAIDPQAPARERWREVVPPLEGSVLAGFAVARGTLVLHYLESATSRLVLTDRDGRKARRLELPALGSVHGLGCEPHGDELYYLFSNYVTPPSVYHVRLDTATRRLWHRVAADVEPEQYAVSLEHVTSRDGTPVSMFLVRRRDVPRDGSAPAFLTGYGGFNIPMMPGFARSYLLWLERGGVLAVPHLRGGGEYGEPWHRGGMLGNKQHTFDDAIAAAEWLVANRWTRPERLAVQGGSNGGLLVGALMTQRPDLVRAAVCQVPLLDMVRYPRFLIARLWIPEYGDPDDPEQFRWLWSYSPYHRVRDREHYPAILIATAESDTRVDPCHARKMAARLQAASASGRPVLLRLEARAGHGAGKPVSKLLDELTDTWSFVFAELGVDA